MPGTPPAQLLPIFNFNACGTAEIEKAVGKVGVGLAPRAGDRATRAERPDARF